jgi:hypothetical protein
MSAIQALKAARNAGVGICIDGDALMLEADAAPPADVLDLVARHKEEVKALVRIGTDGWSGEDWWAYFEERAGIGEFGGGLPRDHAESGAYACCIAEWLNRNPVTSQPGCCIACGGGEQPHDALLPFGTDPPGHVWLHSGCWRAWHEGRMVEASAALATFGIGTRRSP